MSTMSPNIEAKGQNDFTMPNIFHPLFEAFSSQQKREPRGPREATPRKVERDLSITHSKPSPIMPQWI